MEVTDMLTQLRGKVTKRTTSLSDNEFDAASTKVRRSLHVPDYKARFGSFEVLNRCFHRSAAGPQDLKEGSFVVTAKFTDYRTPATTYEQVTVAVPPGITIKTLDFETVFENYSDAIEALLEGRRCTVDDSGPGWPTDDLPGMTHDSRVFARRDVLNRACKWLTISSDELLDMFRYTGLFEHEQIIYQNSVSSFGMDIHLALLVFILQFRTVRFSFRLLCLNALLDFGTLPWYEN